MEYRKMTTAKLLSIVALATAAVAALLFVISYDQQEATIANNNVNINQVMDDDKSSLRRLSSSTSQIDNKNHRQLFVRGLMDPRTVKGKHSDVTDDQITDQILLNNVRALCSEDDNNDNNVEYPTPNYETWCEPDSMLNIIPFFGGMTNGLKFVLLGALMSLDEGRCFMVSEEGAHLTGKGDEFIAHFFENIGLTKDHPFVQKAFKEGRTQVRPWHQYWMQPRQRRAFDEIFDYSHSNHDNNGAAHDVGYYGKILNGHTEKRDFLRRMWHLKPKFRDATCYALRDVHKLFPFNENKEDGTSTDYIAYSVRRGDKTTEGFQFPDMIEYIHATHSYLPNFNNDTNPTIFVATDDCTVLPELRKLRPSWTFKSQCPEKAVAGFDIHDARKWNQQEMEEHFVKFFVELYALAFSKIYIGVSYTNVAWFAYFLRPELDKSSYILLPSTNIKNGNTNDLTTGHDFFANE